MDDDLISLFFCDNDKGRRGAEAPQYQEGLTAQGLVYGEMHKICAPIYGLPVEVMAHVLNGLDSSGRPLFDPLWRFAARATCRLWRDILAAPEVVEARAIVRAWRHGRVDRRERVHCHCAPCTHTDGGGLKHLIATGRLVTATCAVALGSRRDRPDDDDDDLFDARTWCASSIPDQDAALCVAMAATTREAVDRVVRDRLAPLFACDADGRCLVRAIERDFNGYYARARQWLQDTAACGEEDADAEYDDGRVLIMDLLAVAARQGRVTVLASLVGLSERVRVFAHEAVTAIVYYACSTDRADTIAWVLRNVVGLESASAHNHPFSLPCAPLSDEPIDKHHTRTCSAMWKAIALYDAVDTMAMVFDAFGQHAAVHPDICDADRAPGTKRWQKRAARSGSVRVLDLCRKRGIALHFDVILIEGAAYGCGPVVRWALAHTPVAEPAVHADTCMRALEQATCGAPRGSDTVDGTDLAIDLLCDNVSQTWEALPGGAEDAARRAIAWWHAADWRRRSACERSCASTMRVALRWRDLLVDHLGPGDAVGFFGSAIVGTDYKTLDTAVSLFAGHRAADGVDLWSMVLDTLYTSGMAMRPYRRHYKPNPYGSPPVRFDRPLHSNDLRPMPADAFFRRFDQGEAAEMVMFLASVCAHRRQVGSATRAQWRSICTIRPVTMDRLPFIDMGYQTAVALPAWLDARGLLTRPS